MAFFATYSVSGNASAGSNASVGAVGGTAPTNATLMGVQSGSLMTALTLGQATMANSLPVTLASNQSNINVSVATALPAGANTIGAVTQASGPWSQNVTQIGGSALTLGQALMAASLPVVLASNQSNIPANITEIAGSALALGQTTMSASLPVTLASNQSVISTADAADGPVAAGTAASKSVLIGAQYNSVLPTLTTGQQAALQSDSSGRLLVGSIASALPAGSNTIGAVTQASGPWTQNLTQVSGSALALGQALMAASLPVTLASNQSNINVVVASALPAGANTIGGVNIASALPVGSNTIGGVNVASALPAGANVIGGVTQSGTWTVQPGNTANTTPWLVDQATSSTSAVTSVSGSATSVSLLAANTSRKGALFFNDSTATLYLKLGTTASTSSYTVQIGSNAYFELPDTKIYTGAIDGIWSSAAGAVRITELT